MLKPQQLKLLRQKKGLTKKAAAKAIGITERAYIAYEYGERDVSTETLVKIAKYFGVTTDYLLGVETESNPLDILRSATSLPSRYRRIRPESVTSATWRTSIFSS